MFGEMMEENSDDELAESMKAIEEGLADVAAGRTLPMDQVFRQLDEKYGLLPGGPKCVRTTKSPRTPRSANPLNKLEKKSLPGSGTRCFTEQTPAKPRILSPRRHEAIKT